VLNVPLIVVHVHVDGVRQCLRTVATNMHTVNQPHGIYEYGDHGGMTQTREIRKTWRKPVLMPL
jgi:hypothetical protein